MKQFLISLVITVVLFGCGPTKIDVLIKVGLQDVLGLHFSCLGICLLCAKRNNGVMGTGDGSHVFNPEKAREQDPNTIYHYRISLQIILDWIG